MEENRGDTTTKILGYVIAVMLASLIAVSLYWIFKGGRAHDTGINYNSGGTIKTPQLSMNTVPSKFV